MIAVKDFLDRSILAVLEDGEPRKFKGTLREVASACFMRPILLRYTST